MRDLKKQERTAIEAVARRFSATWEVGSNPPDAYIMVAGKRVAVDITTLKRRGTGQGNGAKPRLRFDKVATRLIERVQATLGSVLRPPVVVPLHAPHPHHGIDAGAAAKYVAEGHIEIAVVQSRRGDNGQVVIERAADIVKPDAWVHDGRRVVGSSRLDDEDLRAGSGQFRGKN